jgi:hypothetical protein
MWASPRSDFGITAVAAQPARCAEHWPERACKHAAIARDGVVWIWSDQFRIVRATTQGAKDIPATALGFTSLGARSSIGSRAKLNHE